MPEIRIIDQKFYSKLNNGDNFDQNLTDFSTHLKGGVLEEIKAVFNVQIEWRIEVSSYDILYSSILATVRIKRVGLNSVVEGFAVGDSIKFSDSENGSFTGVITSLKLGEIIFDNVVVTAGTLTVGWTTGESTDTPAILTGLTPKTALKFDFGLIENNEPINFLSKLTDTTQSYLFEDIDHVTPSTFTDGKTMGNNKAGYSGSTKVAFIGLFPDTDTEDPGNTTQQFQIEHIFTINPIYRDGELDSLKGIDVPPLDIFNGDMSLKYVFQTEFRTVLNNPNTSMISEYDTQLGSVGYLDESFNGFESDFSITNLNYELDGVLTDRLEVGKVTKAFVRLTSASSLFASGNTPLIVGHTSVIDSSKYVNSDKTYDDLWVNENERTTQGTVVSGDVIKVYQITGNSTSIIDFQFEVDLTGKDLEDEQDYLLYFTVGDPSKTVDEGTKVTGRIDVNYYYKNPDVAGLFDFDTFEQYPHPEAFEEGVSTGFTNASTFNESGMMANGRFWVLNSANLNDLKFDLVVYDFANDTWDSLRSLRIDLSEQTTVSGIQQIELDSTRGYVLADGDIFNYLKITTDTNSGTKQYYNIQVGYKIPWQSWLESKDAPSEFYDKTKPLNGLNQKASNYSLGANYGIKVLFDAVVDSTNYVKTSEVIDVFDYDSPFITDWTCAIQTYKQDPTDANEVIAIEGNIIQDGYTQVQAVFTPSVPPVFTSSVDMTEVADDWNRFAHGSKYTLGASQVRLNGDPQVNIEGTWANDQSGYVDSVSDTMLGLGSVVFNKDQSLYSSSTNQITTTDNLGALYGCFSLDKYENYEIKGEMFSSNADNDGLVYNIAFNVDEFGIERTLSLCATTGGILLDINPSYIEGDDTSNSFLYSPSAPNNVVHWALVYNFGKSDCKQLDVYRTSNPNTGWGNLNQTTQTFEFNVKRAGDSLVIVGDWDLPSGVFNDTFNYNLNDNEETKIFKGFQNIGFSFQSQNEGGFKNVVLTKPNDEFYSIIRMEPKNSQSDNTINELSTIIEAPSGNLLTQITGSEKLATLEYDAINNKFVCSCLVNTALVEKGNEYDFSAEIRPRDLEV